MNLRNLNLRTLTLTAWLIANSLHWSSAVIAETKEKINAVYNKKVERKGGELDKEEYKIHLDNAGLYNMRNFIMPNWENIIISRTVEDLKTSRLFMHWTKRNIWEFLGYKQAENIIKKYNPEENGAISINEFKEIDFPLIYDKLKNKVPATLSELMTNEKLEMYKDTLAGTNTMIVVLPDENGKEMLAYYVNNQLFVCTYVSLGLKWEWRDTPKWLFALDSKSANRRSKKYDNVPMPYAMHIIWGIFMHQGTSDGSKRSHGCIRVPGLYEEFLFYYVETGTKIVIL